LLNVGDAVLTFIADTTQLDQACARIPDQVDGAMSAAADSVDQVSGALKGVQFELDATASNATYAGGVIGDSMGKLAEKIQLVKEQMAELAYEESFVGQTTKLLEESFGELGTVIVGALGVEAFKSQIEGAQKSVLALELLSEKTGIAIGTMAGIEHVAEAAGVKFDEVATALTRLTRAQALAIEGNHQQVSAFQRIGISVEELKTMAPEELFFRVGEALANASSHSAAAASAFGLLGRGGAALIPMFQQNRDELRGMVEEAGRVSGVTKEAALSAREWEAQSANLSETWRAILIPIMQGSIPVIRAVETAFIGVEMYLRGFAGVIGGVGLGITDTFRLIGTVVDDVVHGNFAKVADDAKQLGSTIASDMSSIGYVLKNEWQTAAESIHHVWTDAKPLKPMKDDLSDLKGSSKDAVAAIQADLEIQVAAIEKWKAEQHLAYESGKIDAASWKVAELQATDAVAIAHEDSLRRVAAALRASGDLEKAHIADLKLSALETKNAAVANDALAAAMAKHSEANRRVIAEYHQLIAASVNKEFEATAKATEKLTAAEDELLKVQSKLLEDKLSQHFHDQEAAITKLAQMHLITEEQKDDRLKLLEMQQASTAIDILERQLAKEKEVMDEAQAKVAYAKANPFSVTPAQLVELETNLAKVRTLYTKTEDDLVQTQEKFNKQLEAVDIAKQGELLVRGSKYYAQALLEAKAFGQDMLAEQLKESHGALLNAEIELKQAKARGVNTDAMKQEVDHLKEIEKALEKAANGDTKALAALLKRNQAELISAKTALADAQARGVDTTAIKQHITALEADSAALQKGLIADKMLLAQQLIQNRAGLLQLQFMRDMLKARGADTTAIDAQIKAMQKLNQVLNQAEQQTPKLSRQMVELRSNLQQCASTMVTSFSTAMQGVITGQESFGKSMEKATLKMLAQMAQHWAEYYLALAIGNMWDDPAAAAGEFAAAAALEAISGTMSGLASGSSGSGSGAAASGPGAGQAQTSQGAGGGSNQTVGVSHLAEGGIVTRRIMIGDSPSGGDAEEAIIPLSNPDALARISNALLSVPTLRTASAGFAASARVAASTGLDESSIGRIADRLGSQTNQGGGAGGSSAGDTHVHVHVKGMISPDNLNKVVKKINRAVQNRQTTLKASDSLRITRRSQ
jgi:hypothetical protein